MLNRGFIGFPGLTRIIESSYSSPRAWAMPILWIMRLMLFLEIDLGSAKTKSALICAIRENPRFRQK